MPFIRFSNAFINIEKVCMIKSIDNERTQTYIIEFWIEGQVDCVDEKFKNKIERDKRINELIGVNTNYFPYNAREECVN